MYKYEYETVSCHFGGLGFGSGTFITSRITARLLRKEPETDGDMSDISPQSSAEQGIRRKWI